MADSNPIYKFRWRGINRNGETLSGKHLATTAQLAKQELHSQGIFVQHIQRDFFSLCATQRIRPADITVFTRQLATLTLAGVPLLQAFSIIIATQKNRALHRLLIKLKGSVANGHPLSQVLKDDPQHFNDFYCNLIAAGEVAGSLDQMLDRIAQHREKIAYLKQRANKALVYPSIIMITASIITLALLLFIVPQFENLFNSFGANLPFATQIIINITHFLQRYGGTLTLIGGSLLGALIFLYKKSTAFLQKLDNFLLTLPVFGKLIKKALIAQIATTLHILLSAGVPLNQALQVTTATAHYATYTRALQQAHTAINKGQTLQTALQQTGKFPPLVEQLISIGEESGKLEIMLVKIADIYAKEVDNIVAALNTVLEPLIMIVLGLVIGGLVIAMYLPIFKLGSIV